MMFRTPNGSGASSQQPIDHHLALSQLSSISTLFAGKTTASKRPTLAIADSRALHPTSKLALQTSQLLAD
jgi:hypothetical protein